jgi:squalene-hopene/tetraprenyl-beta-curcumene cyclase
MTRRTFLSASIATLAASAFAQDAKPAAKPDPTVQKQAGDALTKGLVFLQKQQKPDGSWSTPDYPAMTALVALSFLRSPAAKSHTAQTGKALDFVRKNAQPDGGIYAKAMGNYNTSICLTALLVANESKDEKIIDAAQTYLVGGQRKNQADPALNGGFGYEAGSGTGRGQRPDLDNTVFTLEALALYRDTHKNKEKKDGLDWASAIQFVTACQNLPSQNKEKWASDAPENKGGFIYSPGDKSLRSYGSMTYAGLLSLIYAEVKKDDPRIAAAFEWLGRNYTLTENPGRGNEALYYYYYVIAKTLAAAKVEELTGPEGKKFNWRKDLTEKLVSLQKPDGSWASENGRYREKDPVLVTCYAVLALDLISAHG